jgi:hypothetical protein
LGTPPTCRVQKPSSKIEFENGAGDGIRTRDPNLGKVVLYQLSYARETRKGAKIIIPILRRKINLPLSQKTAI